MKIAHLAPLAAFAAIAAALAVGLRNDPRALPLALVDQPLPDFSLAPLHEGAPPLTDEAVKGRPAMINLFGSWCAGCIIEHPVLMQIAAQTDTPIFGVDWKDTRADGAAFLAGRGDPYTAIGMDPDSRLAIDLGVTGAPETFIIDAEGRIRGRHVGPITEEAWRDTIAPMLAELERAP